MHVSVPLLCGSLLPFLTGSLALPKARAEKHYAIMDNDWYTAGFVPFLIALDGNVEVLGLASGEFILVLISAIHPFFPLLRQVTSN